MLRAVPETADDTRAVLRIVGLGARVDVDEVVFERFCGASVSHAVQDMGGSCLALNRRSQTCGPVKSAEWVAHLQMEPTRQNDAGNHAAAARGSVEALCRQTSIQNDQVDKSVRGTPS